MRREQETLQCVEALACVSFTKLYMNVAEYMNNVMLIVSGKTYTQNNSHAVVNEIQFSESPFSTLKITGDFIPTLLM